MTDKVEFDYSKLRGRIVEKVGSLLEFANAIGISNTSLNDRLQSRIAFSQRDIYKSMDSFNLV